MQLLLAVVEDLYTFAVSLLFSRRGEDIDTQLRLSLPASRVVSAFREPVEIDVPPPLSVMVEESLFAEESDAASHEWAVMEEVLPQKHTLVYCAQSQVPLRTMPDGTADTVIADVWYGDMLMLLEAGPEWSHVGVGNKKGYVPTDTIVQKAADVYPTFLPGEANGAQDENTTRLRLVIRDEFSTRLSQLPLQAHEYVYYKLLRRGTHIDWPDTRPRTPGCWARILSVLPAVSLSDVPSTGAIMEYMSEEGEAHLSYVEKVFSDHTIQLSDVGWPDRGIYNERVMEENEWRALTLVFIVIA